LATTEEHKVPPTIVSRCQRLMFRLVNQSDLVEHLDSVARRESIEITREALELMTRRSGGGLRDALGLLDQAALLSRPEEPVSASDLLILLGALNEDVLIEISEAVRVGGGSDALAKINELLMQGREPSLIAVELAKHFLNLTKASYLKENSAAVESQQLISGSASYVEKLIAQSCHYERSELSQIVERLDSMEQNIKRSTQPSMTLEMGILSICHRHDILSIAGLNQRIDDLERILEGDSGGNQLLKSRESDRPQATRPQASEHPYSKSSSDSPPPKIVEPKPQPQTEIHQPVSEPQVEAMPIVDHQTAITEPEQVEKPEPAQEPEQQAAKDRENPTGLEEVWSDIMDALHKRSIPAYSLVSMHAFPVSLENSQLTLGVNKEFFQKSIEGKAAHLIEAYKTLTGQDIVVKVKVLSEAPPSKKNSNGRNVVEKASEPESSPIKSDPEEAVSITDFGEARRSHTDTLTKAYTETITHAGSLSA
ncbi:MAG: hypothetical protein K8F91_17210, partial [Candidatus Obscuribacterales bacterium]|nr:hypothetical protein [Candidatus Obscuribacterales bacterium]